MHSNYLNSVIRQLRDQQVRFAPRERQIEQADSAERLLKRTRSEADVHLEIRLSPGHE